MFFLWYRLAFAQSCRRTRPIECFVLREPGAMHLSHFGEDHARMAAIDFLNIAQCRHAAYRVSRFLQQGKLIFKDSESLPGCLSKVGSFRHAKYGQPLNLDRAPIAA